MEFEKLVVPPLENNCYVVYSKHEAIIIDPAQGAEAVLEFLKKNKLELKLIVNTHGHSDHIIDNERITGVTKAKLAIHKDDEYRLSRQTPFGNMPDFCPSNADILLEEGNRLRFGNDELLVMHTPGHTEGSICLYSEKHSLLFSGDTLFAGSYGRVDFQGSDPEKMDMSLRRLSKLPRDTRVFPGHGNATTIGNERWLNTI